MTTVQIPGYRIVSQIGEGAMGFVFKAEQISLGRMVAVKVLRAEMVSDPTAVAQFRLEANSVAHLKHSNILQIYEAGETNGLPFFVMEYVSAYSVSTWLQRKGRLREADVLTVADSVGRALQYAWDKAGLIHCDLKPDNILVDEDGLIKVADFSGLSRDNLGPEARLIANLTIGTPNYMAPEQVLGAADLDSRVDIYALGAVMYHLLTGLLPFRHLPEAEAMQAQVNDFLPDPTEANPDVSLPAALLMEKMLVKDRAARPQRWEDVLSDIARVRAGQKPAGNLPASGTSTVRMAAPVMVAAEAAPASVLVRATEVPPKAAPKAAPAPGVAPRRRRMKLAILLVIALVLLLADLCLYLAIRKRPPPPRVPEPPVEPLIPEGLVPTPVVPTPTPVVPTPAPTPEPAPAPTPPPPEPKPPVPMPVPEPPAPAPAPAPEPKPPADPLRDPAALRSYLDLMQSVIPACARRQYDAASSTLGGWMQDHAGHAYADKVRVEQERVARAAGLFGLIERNRDRVKGVSLQATTGAAGQISGLSAGVLTVLRRFGESGMAETRVEVAKLHPDDLAALWRAADERSAPLTMAAFLISQAQFPSASDQLVRAETAALDTAFERAWLEDWQRTARNLRASKAVDDVKALVIQSRFKEARAALQKAREAGADTDVFDWMRRAEIEEIDKGLQQELGAGPAPEPPKPPETPAKPPDEGTPAAKPPEGMPPPDPATVARMDAVAATAGEVLEKLATLDRKLIRLEFVSRSSITLIGPGTYQTDLGDSGTMISVEFPQAGYEWVSDVPVMSGRAKSRVVYGVLDGPRRTLILVGRSRKSLMGGRGSEYTW